MTIENHIDELKKMILKNKSWNSLLGIIMLQNKFKRCRKAKFEGELQVIWACNADNWKHVRKIFKLNHKFFSKNHQIKKEETFKWTDF